LKHQLFVVKIRDITKFTRPFHSASQNCPPFALTQAADACACRSWRMIFLSLLAAVRPVIVDNLQN